MDTDKTPETKSKFMSTKSSPGFIKFLIIATFITVFIPRILLSPLYGASGGEFIAMLFMPFLLLGVIFAVLDLIFIPIALMRGILSGRMLILSIVTLIGAFMAFFV